MKKSILIIDDMEVNRAILSQAFARDYIVHEAEDGEKALSILEQHGKEIDLIVLDLRMPRMDGFTFLEKIKTESSYKMIPVIVATEIRDTESEIRALELGAADFISTPYDISIILQRAKNLIEMRDNLGYKEISEKDSLTGIYNRKTFYRKAYELIHKNTEITYDICTVDIDKFKVVNDLFGTFAGDKLLIFLAKVISDCIPSEAVCGRLTGDNFAMCIPHRDNYEKEIANIFKNELKGYPLGIRIFVRCGFYRIHDLEIPIEIMCDRANMAIMKIKGSYSTMQSVYDDKIRKKILQEQEILNEMNQALEQEQFTVYYQPKFNMESGKVIGAEALVRWIHPKKGLISPGVFIPIFEKNGFIAKLDQYVWEHVCQDFRTWRNLGYTLCPVSINVSRAELYNQNLTKVLSKMIRKYDIPARLLELEITETAYTENPEQLIEVVEKLKELGYTILMDDFGSGYSSLNTLKDVPVDELKLDLKFLYNMDHNLKANYILKSVVQMAKRLELSVIAEGVETEQQAEFLKSIGCFRAQGYLYAKPMPRNEYEKYICDADRVSDDLDQFKEGIANIDDIMSRYHREDELDWYRSAVIQMNAVLYEYDIQNDLMLLFDMQMDEDDKELVKIELPNFVTTLEKKKLIHKDDIEICRNGLKTGNLQNLEFRIHNLGKRRGYFWYRETGRTLYTSDGKPKSHVGVLREITEEKVNDTIMRVLTVFENQYKIVDILKKSLPLITDGFVVDRIAVLLPPRKNMIEGHTIWYDANGNMDYTTLEDHAEEAVSMFDMFCDKYGIGVVDCANSGEIPEVFRNMFFSHEEKTIAFSRIKMGTDYRGMICYMYADGRKKLTEEDRKGLGELTKCIATSMNRLFSDFNERELLELYKIVYKKSQIKLWEWNIKTKCLKRSEAAQKDSGYMEDIVNAPEHIIEQGIIHKDYIETYRQGFQKLTEGQDQILMFKCLQADGYFKWMRIDYSVILDENGKPAKAIGFGEDVNLIYETQSKIRDEIKYESNILSNAILYFDADLTTDTYQNMSGRLAGRNLDMGYEKFTTFTAQELVNEPYREGFLACFERENLLQHFKQGRLCQYFVYQVTIPSLGVKNSWVEACVYLEKRKSDGHICCFSFIRDLNLQISWHKYLKGPIEVEGEVSIYKEVSFREIVKGRLTETDEKRNSALVLIDMDKFLLIKETFGIEYANEILFNVVTIIKASVPEGCVIGRVGVDRFGIFFDRVENAGQVSTFANKVQKRIFSAFHIGTKTYVLSGSVGVAFTEEGSSYEILYDQAVANMLEVK